jgi:sulfate adenylyltransferase
MSTVIEQNTTKVTLIPPHGGKLVNRLAAEPAMSRLAAEAEGLPKIALDVQQQCDVEMIAIGAFSPLEGFMGAKDYRSVCEHMRLAGSRLPWPIPILCPVDAAVARAIKLGQRVCLTDDQARPLAVLTVREKFARDKDIEIEVICANYDVGFERYRLPPAETRRIFAERGWKTVVAFQTRNPIHRAHEYLTKCALEICDGLLIHPLVGHTKSDDISAEVRMKCYEHLIDNYYNKQRVLLSVMPAAMRYAGPREAILHAIIRKNYGCTHFIVGRDHAGVGSYYGTYDAQRIFDEIDAQTLGIVPLKFEHSVWCNKCQSMVSAKTCPHGKESHVFLSGTKVREMLKAGQLPPSEFTRPEIARILMEGQG